MCADPGNSFLDFYSTCVGTMGVNGTERGQLKRKKGGKRRGMKDC